MNERKNNLLLRWLSSLVVILPSIATLIALLIPASALSRERANRVQMHEQPTRDWSGHAAVRL